MIPAANFMIIKLKQVKYYSEDVGTGIVDKVDSNDKKSSSASVAEHRIKDIRSLVSLVQLGDASPKNVVAIKQKLLYQREGMPNTGDNTDQLSKKTLTIKGKDG